MIPLKLHIILGAKLLKGVISRYENVDHLCKKCQFKEV